MRLDAALGFPSGHTYLGGDGSDFGYDITNDADGNLVVTGDTAVPGNPFGEFPTLDPAQATREGVIDAFLAKLDTNLDLIYSTFVAESTATSAIDSDSGRAVAVANGLAYVAGYRGPPNHSYLAIFDAASGLAVSSFTIDNCGTEAEKCEVSGPVQVATATVVLTGPLGGTALDIVGGPGLLDFGPPLQDPQDPNTYTLAVLYVDANPPQGALNIVEVQVELNGVPSSGLLEINLAPPAPTPTISFFNINNCKVEACVVLGPSATPLAQAVITLSVALPDPPDPSTALKVFDIGSSVHITFGPTVLIGGSTYNIDIFPAVALPTGSSETLLIQAEIDGSAFADIQTLSLTGPPPPLEISPCVSAACQVSAASVGAQIATATVALDGPLGSSDLTLTGGGFVTFGPRVPAGSNTFTFAVIYNPGTLIPPGVTETFVVNAVLDSVVFGTVTMSLAGIGAITSFDISPCVSAACQVSAASVGTQIATATVGLSGPLGSSDVLALTGGFGFVTPGPGVPAGPNTVTFAIIYDPLTLLPPGVPVSLPIDAELNSVGFGAVTISLIGADDGQNDPPEADLQAASPVECGDDIVLDASGSTDPNLPDDTLTFSWTGPGIAAIEDGQVVTVSGLGVGDHTFSVTVTDSEGATDSASVTVTVEDTTPPVTVASVAAANANGWYKTNVTFSLSASDSCSVIASITYTLSGAQTGGSTDPGASTTAVISAEGTTTITFFATDVEGNVEVAQTLTVKIDKTDPVVTPSRLPLGNVFGWNNTDVTASFVCTDALSGIDATFTFCDDQVIATEGLGQSATATATDLAGNTGSGTVGNINIDKTPPTIGADPDPDPNGAGWYNTVPVTVSFIAGDGLSGINTVTAPITFTSEGSGQVANGVATDKAGNSSTTSFVVNIDLTPPEFKNVFNEDTLTVDVLALDDLSGVTSDPIVPVCVPTRWGSAKASGKASGKARSKRPNAEECTYTVTDVAGNTTVLVENRKTTGSNASKKGSSKKGSGKNSSKGGGGEIQIQVVSIQYNGGDVIAFPPKADKKFKWSLNRDLTLKELEQKMELGRGRTKQQVTAHYSSKKGTTEINVHGGGGKLVGDGLRLLCMISNDGELEIVFDPAGLTPKNSVKPSSKKESKKESAKPSKKPSEKPSAKPSKKSSNGSSKGSKKSKGRGKG